MFEFKSLARLAALVVSCVALSACVTVKTSAPRSGDTSARPASWGMLSPPEACVIFAEYRKTEVGFFVVAVSTRTTGELRVLETSGYTLPKDVWSMSDEEMQALQELATQDGLRFVKIPEKHSPEELEAARAACGVEMG